MTIEELRQIAENERAAQKRYSHHVCVCIAAGCLSSGAAEVREALQKEAIESGMQNEVLVKGVGCMGLCSAGPLVSVSGDGQVYSGVTAEEAPAIVQALDTGINGIAVYVMVYTFMNLGAFLVIIAMRRANIIGEDLDDLAGLVHKSPGYAFLMLIFLLSLAGIPPTAGFLGKYYIFLALIQTGHIGLAIVATLYVAVAIYYYFKIVRSMFIREELEKTPALATSLGLRFALAFTGIATLAIGIYPEPFLRLAQTSLFR